MFSSIYDYSFLSCTIKQYRVCRKLILLKNFLFCQLFFNFSNNSEECFEFSIIISKKVPTTSNRPSETNLNLIIESFFLLYLSAFVYLLSNLSTTQKTHNDRYLLLCSCEKHDYDEQLQNYNIYFVVIFHKFYIICIIFS